ncbi:hypothetical protein JCM6882_009314 [Rhodosporidiobolus microsporus]
MTNKSKEPCWICGELTTTRCGACEEAGIDIFFCSREHQKLVWPVHKLVCGPGKANPFVWPAFFPEELAILRAELDVCFRPRSTVGPSNPSAREWLAFALKVPVDTVQSITTLCINLMSVPGPQQAAFQQTSAAIRSTECHRFVVNCSAELDPPLLPKPLLALQYAALFLWHFLDYSLYLSPPSWFSSTHHRILIFSYLYWRAVAHGEQSFVEYARHSGTVAQAVVQDGLGSTNAERGERLIQRIKESLRQVEAAAHSA